MTASGCAVAVCIALQECAALPIAAVGGAVVGSGAGAVVKTAARLTGTSGAQTAHFISKFRYETLVKNFSS
jgi:hypothetical protein